MGARSAGDERSTSGGPDELVERLVRVIEQLAALLVALQRDGRGRASDRAVVDVLGDEDEERAITARANPMTHPAVSFPDLGRRSRTDLLGPIDAAVRSRRWRRAAPPRATIVGALLGCALIAALVAVAVRPGGLLGGEATDAPAVAAEASAADESATPAPLEEGTAGATDPVAADPVPSNEPPPAQPPPAGPPRIYQVQPGDAPWSIAARAGVRTEDLLTLNGLQPGDVIYAGQELRLPDP